MDNLQLNVTEPKMQMYSINDCPEYIQKNLKKDVVRFFEYSISLMMHDKKMKNTNPNYLGKGLPVYPSFSEEYATTHDIKNDESPLMTWFRLINETVNYISSVEKMM